MYCSKCGIQLVQGAAFCANCGNRIDIQAPAAGPPSGGDETVLILTATRKLSLMNAVVCNVVFKQSGFVLAHLTQALQKTENARLMNALKAQNVGVLKRTAATMNYWASFHERYFTMPTVQILAEDPANMAFGYAMVSSIEFRCFSRQTSYDDDGSNSSTETQGKLTISFTNGETLKMTHKMTHSRTIQDALAAIFGTRLKYRK
jgi:uncharacterized membrane protein